MASPFEFFWNEYAKSVYGTEALKKLKPKLHMVCKEIEQPERDPTEDYYPCPLCKVSTSEDELLDNSGCCTGCTNRLVNRHFGKSCVFVRVFQDKSWEIKFIPVQFVEPFMDESGEVKFKTTLLSGFCLENFPCYSV